jgi:cytoskeletal protein CcmA (bactofilin family)
MSAYGCPECNRMATDLDLGYNDIVNVSSVATENLDVQGESTFTGDINFQDSATFQGDVTVSNADLTVEGQMSVIGTLDITNGINVRGNVAATNALFETADAVTLQAGEIEVSNLNVTEAMRVQVGDLSVATTQDINVLGKVETNTMSAYQMSVSGDLFANTMDIEGSVNVDGMLDMTQGGNNGIISVPNIEIQNCMVLDGVQYGPCN